MCGGEKEKIRRKSSAVCLISVRQVYKGSSPVATLNTLYLRIGYSLTSSTLLTSSFWLFSMSDGRSAISFCHRNKRGRGWEKKKQW